MAYRFKPGKNLEQELRRIASQQLERASAELTDPELAPARAVHQARKRLKKLRGLLRLVHPALDRGIYKHWNRRFRDLGRSLADARDADVLQRTLDAIEEAMRNQAAAPDLTVLRRGIEQRQTMLRGEASRIGCRVYAEKSKRLRKRIESWWEIRRME